MIISGLDFGLIIAISYFKQGHIFFGMLSLVSLVPYVGDLVAKPILALLSSIFFDNDFISTAPQFLFIFFPSGLSLIEITLKPNSQNNVGARLYVAPLPQSITTFILMIRDTITIMIMWMRFKWYSRLRT